MQRQTFSRYAWMVLVLNVLVILWGAYVRATGSGAGCGSHWPTCNGDIIPREPSAATLIEFSHRLTSGFALLAVVALLWFACRLFPSGHRVRRAAWAGMILMLLEAAIGAGIVLFQLVADNESMARAMFMAVHLANTLLLLAALTLTPYYSTGGPPLGKLTGRAASKWIWLSIFGTILVAVSGAVAALGDTLYPVKTFAEGLQQELSATSHILIKLRVLHPIIAVAVGILILLAISEVRATKPPPTTRRYANWLNLMVMVQMIAGGINVLLAAPIWLQILHLLFADLLWIALVLMAASFFAAKEAT